MSNSTLDTLLRRYETRNSCNNLLNYENEIMNHSELERESNKFAEFLIRLGVKKGERVIIMLELNIETIVAIFGIIKTGAIYVPLDENMQKENVDYVLQLVSPSVCIYDKKYEHNFEMYKGHKVVYGTKQEEHYTFESYKDLDGVFEKRKIISKDIVYIIFTSGTTGHPKGVMVNHKAIITFLEHVVCNHYHGKLVRSLCRTPIAFDPFLTEVLPSVISGGQVYIQNRNVGLKSFLKFLEEKRITNFGCGPALLLLLKSNINVVKKYDLSALHDIYIGYEKCPVSVIKFLMEEYPHINFINGYGTTETFAASTFHFISAEDLDNEDGIAIGTPINNVEIFVVNREGKLAKNGEVGELVIRGDTVFPGYWNDEEKTSNQLRKHPFLNTGNEMVYYTGDLAKKDEMNNIFFVGRKDDQVKIKGYRVELGEIQNVVEQNRMVKECCILLIKDRLVCFYNTYTKEKIEVELATLCKKKLVKYKCPKEYIYIDTFGRNHNGKIDRKELRERYVKAEIREMHIN